MVTRNREPDSYDYDWVKSTWQRIKRAKTLKAVRDGRRHPFEGAEDKDLGWELSNAGDPAESTGWEYEEIVDTVTVPATDKWLSGESPDAYRVRALDTDQLELVRFWFADLQRWARQATSAPGDLLTSEVFKFHPRESWHPVVSTHIITYPIEVLDPGYQLRLLHGGLVVVLSHQIQGLAFAANLKAWTAIVQSATPDSQERLGLLPLPPTFAPGQTPTIGPAGPIVHLRHFIEKAYSRKEL